MPRDFGHKVGCIGRELHLGPSDISTTASPQALSKAHRQVSSAFRGSASRSHNLQEELGHVIFFVRSLWAAQQFAGIAVPRL
jgi:hypothetical protein